MKRATLEGGVIRSDECYTKSEFCRRVGISQFAWRTARRNGLRVIETAGRCYVRGSDWLAYLDECSRKG